MDITERTLQRLIKAAARSPAKPSSPLPPSLETALIAQWRREPPDEWLVFVRLVRRAVVCAGLVMLLSVGWSWLDRGETVPGSTAFAHLDTLIQELP